MDSSPSRFKALIFLNSRDTTFQAHALRDLIEPHFPDLKVYESLVPGKDREQLIHYLLPFLMPNSLVVGIGLDGTIACYLQQEFPAANLSVIAINSPTSDTYTTVGMERSMVLKPHHNRVALYSRLYEPIRGRNDWRQLTDHDLEVSWLQHGIFSESGANLSKYAVAYYVTAYLQSSNLEPAVASFPTQ
ncbi:MAG: hypothetical protein LAO08_06480 [Acidobacteriia bacterium]|nr:hypothetical protein [Terriglobia bacterium]